MARCKLVPRGTPEVSHASWHLRCQLLPCPSPVVTSHCENTFTLCQALTEHIKQFMVEQSLLMFFEGDLALGSRAKRTWKRSCHLRAATQTVNLFILKMEPTPLVSSSLWAAGWDSSRALPLLKVHTSLGAKVYCSSMTHLSIKFIARNYAELLQQNYLIWSSHNLKVAFLFPLFHIKFSQCQLYHSLLKNKQGSKWVISYGKTVCWEHITHSIY